MLTMRLTTNVKRLSKKAKDKRNDDYTKTGTCNNDRKKCIVQFEGKKKKIEENGQK